IDDDAKALLDERQQRESLKRIEPYAVGEERLIFSDFRRRSFKREVRSENTPQRLYSPLTAELPRIPTRDGHVEVGCVVPASRARPIVLGVDSRNRSSTASRSPNSS